LRSQGATRVIPELGKGIGEGIRGFKPAMKEHEDTFEKNNR
jgi:Sec-independent protein translocase protein TatA